MSLQTRIAAFITAVGADVKQIQSDVNPIIFGDLGAEQTAVTVGSGGNNGTTGVTHAQDEYNGGMYAAEVDLNWHNLYQVGQNTVDAPTLALFQAAISALKTANRQLTLDTRADTQPTWLTTALSSVAGAHFVGEDGTVSSEINYVFSKTARSYWEHYVDQIDTNFGLKNFSSIRIGSVHNSELLYPSTSFHWWAYDVNAQGAGTDLAKGQTVTPSVGWHPGSTSITTTQVQAWLDWYVKSLANTAIWQMEYYRSKGFTGWFEIVNPGQGERPSQEATNVAAYLANVDYAIVGALWHKIYRYIPNTGDVRMHFSSVADDSGIPANDLPLPGDQNFALTDPAIVNWSATRWQTYLARRHGFPISMEQVGWTSGNTAHYSDTTATGMAAITFKLVDAVRPTIFYWAHSNKIWDGTLPFVSVLKPYLLARVDYKVPRYDAPSIGGVSLLTYANALTGTNFKVPYGTAARPTARTDVYFSIVGGSATDPDPDWMLDYDDRILTA